MLREQINQSIISKQLFSNCYIIENKSPLRDSIDPSHLIKTDRLSDPYLHRNVTRPRILHRAPLFPKRVHQSRKPAPFPLHLHIKNRNAQVAFRDNAPRGKYQSARFD